MGIGLIQFNPTEMIRSTPKVKHTSVNNIAIDRETLLTRPEMALLPHPHPPPHHFPTPSIPAIKVDGMLGIPAGFSKPIPIIYRRRRRRSGGDVTHASPATEASDRRPHSNGRHRVRAPRPGTVPTGARTGSASRLPI